MVNINTGNFGSGFPTKLNSSETLEINEYMKCGWNLNKLPSLPGSLLSFKSSDT